MERHEFSRPIVWISFTCFAALLFAAFFGAYITPYLCAGLLIIGILLCAMRVYRSDPALVAVVLTAAAAFGVYSVLSWFTVLPAEKYVGGKYTVQAEILSEAERSYGNFYYTARVTHIEEPAQDTNFTIRLSHGEALDVQVGDTVHCTVKFFSFDEQFGLSSKTSQLADGKVLGGYIADYGNITVSPAAQRPLEYYCAELRAYIRERIQQALPQEEASVLSAMLLGLRGDISDSLNDAYRSAGASHILVISGMHMAIITQFMLGALAFLGLRKRWAAGLTILFIAAFMTISGMSASIVRSGIMQILLLIGIMLGRKTDALNSLAVALLCLMISNPFCVGDISLLLSFSSTLGIIELSPRLIHFLTGRIGKVRRRQIAVQLFTPIVTSVCAILGALPVQLYVFGSVNIASVLSSLLVLYASAWIIRFGVGAVLCLSIPLLAPAAAPFTFLSGLLIRYQNWIVRVIAKYIPSAVELSGASLQGTVVIAVMFLLAAFWICGRKRLPAAAFVMAIVLVLSGTVIQGILTENSTKLLVIDNGYAQCTAWIDGHRAVLLSCDGSSSSVSSVLKDHDVRTIELILVGEKETEIRCAEDLVEQFETERIVTTESVYFPADCPVDTFDYGCIIEVSPALTLSVSNDGDLISFEYAGTQFISEMQGAAYSETTADILVTNTADTKISAPLTILCTEKSLEEHSTELKSGNYLLTSEHETICLTVESDGSYKIQNG